MPRRSREAYLWDIVDSCRAILEFVQGKEFCDFEQNRMLRRAVERELSVVGEAVSQATRHIPDLEDSIGPVRQIVGFRNRIIHEYAEVDTEVVWANVENEVPPAARKVRGATGGVGSWRVSGHLFDWATYARRSGAVQLLAEEATFTWIKVVLR